MQCICVASMKRLTGYLHSELGAGLLLVGRMSELVRRKATSVSCRACALRRLRLFPLPTFRSNATGNTWLMNVKYSCSVSLRMRWNA